MDLLISKRRTDPSIDKAVEHEGYDDTNMSEKRIEAIQTTALLISVTILKRVLYFLG